jgi:hypothetical protein
MKFKLEIELDDNSTYSDITWMLQQSLRTCNALNETVAVGADGSVYDQFRNIVGTWVVSAA